MDHIAHLWNISIKIPGAELWLQDGRKFLLSTFEKGHGLLFAQTLIPFTHGYSVQGLVEIAPMVIDKNILIFHQCIYPYFTVIFLWKRVWPLICINLNSLHPKMFFAKLVEICPVVLMMKIFKCHWWILAFSLLSPCGKSLTLHLNKVKFPIP